MTSDNPKPLHKYEHYKGGKYVVTELANHTETMEVMVVYKSLDFKTLWVRPLSEWLKPIDGQPNSKRFWEIKS